MLKRGLRTISQSLSKLVKDDGSDVALPVSLASPTPIACRCPSGYLSGPNLAKQQHRRGVVLTFAISCASGMTLSASLVKSFSGLKIFPSDMFGCGRADLGTQKLVAKVEVAGRRGLNQV
jgi:hypothetical protein